MRIKAMVIGVAKETWFRGQRDERQVTVLNLIDRESHLGQKLRDTFAYTPTQDEAKEINLDALDGAEIVLGVHLIKAATGGQMKFAGQIDRSALPKGCLIAPANGQAKG